MFSNARLNRLFAADHRCFDLAIDHGVFRNAEFLAGIEDLPAAVATAVKAGPDAIQLGVGQTRWLTGIAGKDKPALVLRGDVANVYGTYLPEQLFCMPLGSLVEQALRADAAAVVLNLFHAADKTELYRQCLANIAAVKAECERYAMPLMIEPLVLEPGSHGDYESSGHSSRIAALVRQAAELGADLIKCDPPRGSFTGWWKRPGGVPCWPGAAAACRRRWYSHARWRFYARAPAESYTDGISSSTRSRAR
jgi:DhnA family fructose-bisphosphate aldolase class Ia